MAWIYLIIGGLFEVGFTTCLNMAKHTTGAISTVWYGGFAVSLVFSMIFLMMATKILPIGTAYAVWTGIGAVGTALLGILLFKEPADFWRIFFVFTLIASIVGLKYVTD
ncbi:MAG: DMT family transporter [Paludibacteraceae bacterium]